MSTQLFQESAAQRTLEHYLADLDVRLSKSPSSMGQLLELAQAEPF